MAFNQWKESKNLVTASQPEGCVVGGYSSNRQSFSTLLVDASCVALIQSQGDITSLVKVSSDLVLEKSNIKVDDKNIKCENRKKILAVFCDICQTMSEGESQNKKHKTNQHEASSSVKVCVRKGCGEAFSTSYEYRQHAKICFYSCPVNLCDFQHKISSKVSAHYRKVHKYDHLTE